MDGLTLLYKLNQTLQEDSVTSGFLDTRTSYDYIYEAAVEFVKQTACISNTQDITTVAETSNYDLAYDYMMMFMRDSNNEFFVKYYDTSAYTFINFREYGAVRASNNTTSTFGSLSGTYKWFGGVLAPNGKIYGIPFNSTSVLCIDGVGPTSSKAQAIIHPFFNKF